MVEVRVHANFTVKDEETFLRDTKPMIEATQVFHILILNKSSYFRVKLKIIRFEPILNQTWT